MESRSRNYGIDLLRILSMMMVVVMHINSKGGGNCFSGMPERRLQCGTFYGDVCHWRRKCVCVDFGVCWLWAKKKV